LFDYEKKRRNSGSQYYTINLDLKGLL